MVIGLVSMSRGFFMHPSSPSPSGGIAQLIANLFANPNKWFQYLGVLLFNLIAFTTTFSLISGLLPNKLRWVQETSLFISLVGSIIITLIVIIKNVNITQMWRLDWAIMLGIIGFTTIMFFTVPPDETITHSELIEILASVGLSPLQIEEINVILREKDYVSLSDIKHLGLSDQQRAEVLEIVQSMISTTPNPPSTEHCYVTATDDVQGVSIRTDPYVSENNKIGELLSGERARAIAYDNGVANLNRWWLILIPNSRKTGWVSDVYTDENNSILCNQLPVN